MSWVYRPPPPRPRQQRKLTPTLFTPFTGAQTITGSGSIVGVAVKNVTTIGTGSEFYHTAYHTQNGWLYLPVPEERPRLVSGGDDVFAVVFPTAPDAALVTSITLIWGEVG